jgi:glucose-6-phosphate dehydrogenase assembly protein OpcA
MSTSSVISPAQPEQILKGLGKLWTSLGEEEKQQGQPTVLRACAMTLIVATDEPDEGRFASQTISELMHEHPSRGIVLAVSDNSNEEPQARVLAEFWKPFGKAQQIGCEQIEVKARSEDWPKVGPILLGLIAADLPVVFWCRYGAALKPQAAKNQTSGLESVMELATKTIVDTQDCPTKSVFSCLARWRENNRIVADLQWTRLTRWREPIAHIFDNVARQNPFAAFKNIEIGYSDEKPTAACFYMGGWLSAPYGAAVSFKKTEGYGPGLHSITMRAADETIALERTGKECMRISSTNGRERRFNYSDPTTTALLTEELGITGPDPAFDTAFARAQELLSEYW